jgi:hypothetical protein
MRGIGTTVWVAAVLAIALSACTKKEAPAPPKAASATQEQRMATPDQAALPGQAAPSGQAGTSEGNP